MVRTANNEQRTSIPPRVELARLGAASLSPSHLLSLDRHSNKQATSDHGAVGHWWGLPQLRLHPMQAGV